MKKYIAVILLSFIISCQMKNNKPQGDQMEDSKEYIKYQTFDEYKLMGVKRTDSKEPYVLAKKELDTISVIKSNNREKVIQYINKGAYWYSKSIIYVDTIPGTKQRLWPTVYEKFIFNDTVVEYKYSLGDSLERIMQRIYVHTKKKCIILVIKDADIENYNDPYNEIKELVTNYKKIFPQKSLTIYEPKFYYLFEKQIKGNILSIYEIDGKTKKIVSSKEMNSLGEFDNKGTMAWWW